MKKLLLILLTISINSFARSGDGAGNGGMGYECKIADTDEKVTMTLDTAENLSQLYPKNYFRNYHQADKTLVNQFLDSIDQATANSSIVLRDYYVNTLLKIASDVLNLNTLKELNLLPKTEFKKLELAKKRLLNETYIYVHLKNDFAPGNLTSDSGEVMLPTNNQLQYYGLNNCRIVQIAVYGYVEIGYVGIVHALRFHKYSLLHMDDFNFKALLWHEIIYQALGDQDSTRTREIVASILQELYF